MTTRICVSQDTCLEDTGYSFLLFLHRVAGVKHLFGDNDISLTAYLQEQ